MFSLLKFIKVFAVFIKFSMDDVLAMVEPDIELIGTWYLASNDLFVPELLK